MMTWMSFLFENCQIIQGRMEKSPTKQVSKESQPEGVQYDVQEIQDVWDGTREKKWRVAGSLFWGLWGASHVPRPRLRQMGHHR